MTSDATWHLTDEHIGRDWIDQFGNPFHHDGGQWMWRGRHNGPWMEANSLAFSYGAPFTAVIEPEPARCDVCLGAATVFDPSGSMWCIGCAPETSAATEAGDPEAWTGTDHLLAGAKSMLDNYAAAYAARQQVEPPVWSFDTQRATLTVEAVPTDDVVNHPSHYTSHPSGVECIQITEHMGFNLGNALKYIWRCDLKLDAIEDLRKAAFYINREIDLRESNSTK